MTGGRIEGHGKTTDGALEVDLRLPPELGGQGGGTNPEQLFAIGFASCFESAIGAVARRIRAEPQDVAIDSRVNLHPTPERGFKLSVGLERDAVGDGDRGGEGPRRGGAQRLPLFERHAREHRRRHPGERTAVAVNLTLT